MKDSRSGQSSVEPWAFVTPSYSGDHARCKLLCRSMDHFVTGDWHHYIVVDKPDLQLFKHFGGPRRTVLMTHDVVPGKMRHLFNIPFTKGRSLWWSSSAGLFAGWHMQQIVKIGIAFKLKTTGMAYCDSDVFFVKPFDVSNLQQNGKLRFYKMEEQFGLANHPNANYARAAIEILNLPDRDNSKYGSYIDNFVTWHRETVLSLCHEIESATRRPWYVAISKRMAVSEYALYGMFVDEVQKSNVSLYTDHTSLCKTLWSKSAGQFDPLTYLQSLAPEQVSIGVQSFLGVDEAVLEKQLDMAISHYSQGETQTSRND